MKLKPIHMIGIAAVGGGALYLMTRKPAASGASVQGQVQLTPAQQAQLQAAVTANTLAMTQMGMNGFSALNNAAAAQQTPQPDEQTDPTQTISNVGQQGQDLVDQGNAAVNSITSLFG